MADLGLERSVQRYLDDGERTVHVVHMFTRAHRSLVAVVAAALGMLALTFVLSFDQSSTRVGLALGAGALAAMATTEYYVLSETSKGLVLLRCSRVRKRATELVSRLPTDTIVEPVGTNLVITDYRVGKRVYSVMRRHQQAMTAIADR